MYNFIYNIGSNEKHLTNLTNIKKKKISQSLSHSALNTFATI